MDSSTVRVHIHQAESRLQEAVSHGEPAIVADLYTDRASVLPPTGRIYSGRGEIRELWEIMMRNGLKEFHITPIEIHVSGEIAYEVGRASVDVELDGAPIVESAKYLAVWRQDSEGWKLHKHMWNTNSPPTVQSAIC